MAKVKMKVAHPDGDYFTEADVPEEVADYLVKNKQAERVTKKRKKEEHVKRGGKQAETATATAKEKR